MGTVILSEAKDLKLRILRSFAVFAAQDDGGRFRVNAVARCAALGRAWCEQIEWIDWEMRSRTRRSG